MRRFSRFTTVVLAMAVSTGSATASTSPVDAPVLQKQVSSVVPTKTLVQVPSQVANTKTETKQDLIPVMSNDVPVASLFDDQRNAIPIIKHGTVISPYDYARVCTILGDALKNNPPEFMMVGLLQTFTDDHDVKCELPVKK